MTSTAGHVTISHYIDCCCWYWQIRFKLEVAKLCKSCGMTCMDVNDQSIVKEAAMLHSWDWYAVSCMKSLATFEFTQYARYVHVVHNTKFQDTRQIVAHKIWTKQDRHLQFTIKYTTRHTRCLFKHLKCRILSIGCTMSKLTAIWPVHETHFHRSPRYFLLVPSKELAIWFSCCAINDFQ